MQSGKWKWDSSRVLRVLREFWDIKDWEDQGYGSMVYFPANSERPAIYFDPIDQKLTLEYPDDYEELPNPDSERFYPDFRHELRKPEDLKEFFDEETAQRIIEECGGDMECIIERAYDEMADELAKELEEEIDNIKKKPPEHRLICGVPVTKRYDIYEETVNDGVVEYTGYFPSVIYEIDLSKTPNEETLKCVIDHINSNW